MMFLGLRKLGNICVSNHVSATKCPRLPGPLAFISKLLNNWSYHDDDTTFRVFSNARQTNLWLDIKSRKLYEWFNEHVKNCASFWPSKNHIMYDPVREAIKDKAPAENRFQLVFVHNKANGQSWTQRDLLSKFLKGPWVKVFWVNLAARTKLPFNWKNFTKMENHQRDFNKPYRYKDG